MSALMDEVNEEVCYTGGSARASAAIGESGNALSIM